MNYPLANSLGRGVCSKDRRHAGPHGALGKCGATTPSTTTALVWLCNQPDGHAGPHRNAEGNSWMDGPHGGSNVTWPDARAEHGIGSLDQLVKRVINNFSANRLSPTFVDSDHARQIVENVVREAYSAGLAQGREEFRAPSTNGPNQRFLDELEKHRAEVHAIARGDQTPTTILERRVRTLTDAVWFLLALAHQPE